MTSDVISSERTLEHLDRPERLDRTRRKPNKKLLIGAAVVLTGVAAWGATYVRSAGLETTDDAQVEGHVVNVSSRLVGRVRNVLVRDNQIVNAGDVLVELESDELDTRVELSAAEVAAAAANVRSAEAQLNLAERSARASLNQAKAGVSQAQFGWTVSSSSREQAAAELRASEIRRDLAESDYARALKLHATGALSEAELDARKSALEAARATAERATAQVETAHASTHVSREGIDLAKGRLDIAEAGGHQIESARALADLARAKLLQAEANKKLAEQNRAHGVIRAPLRGVVSRRTVEVGQVVSPERPLLALVGLDDVWVVANFKEGQIARMQAGQSSRVSIDAYGGRELSGHVESLAGAAGARFSLLPPDNATGNFVKVVQRIPVLIRVDDAAAQSLRPGMNAVATVKVGR
ncbi:MAG TPA: HlyD family secretion protein [Labilithrix sp.]|nr:HlyD family secretion protein [Labilithrix sp.]